MSRRRAPVLVDGGLRLVLSVAGMTHDNMFRLYVLQYGGILIEFGVDNCKKKRVMYLVQSRSVLENSEACCAQWMQVSCLSGMLQECISTRERSIPGR